MNSSEFTALRRYNVMYCNTGPNPCCAPDVPQPPGPGGPTGPAGPLGPTGADGVTGPAGADGYLGGTGPTGAIGPQGIPGTSSLTGATGPQGLQGATGFTGPQGIPGTASLTGATGPQGLQGATGFTGAQGPQGINGADGATGSTGAQGIQGVTGPVAQGSNIIGSFYSTLDQPIGNGTDTIFSYTDAPIENGVYLDTSTSPSTRIYVTKTGIYETYFSIQLNKTQGGNTANVYIWLRVNGVDEPWTNGKIVINSNNAASLPIVLYDLRLTAGQYIEFIAQTDQDYVLIQQETGVPGPDIPSIIVGIKEVATDIGSTGFTGAAGPQGVVGPTGPTGSAGQAGIGGGLVLYMNYSQDTSPAITPLTAAQLTTITGQTFQNPSVITYNPTQNTDVSLLATSPNLTLPQTTISFTTPNSATIDVPIVQFAISKSSIPNVDGFMPPGIWTMAIYAKAGTQNDENFVSLRFYLLGRQTSGGAYVNLVANGSDLNYMYDATTSQKLDCDLYIQNPIDISSYDLFQVVVTSRNLNNNSHQALVYFQSSNTYSHIHTTFGIPGVTGPTGSFPTTTSSALTITNATESTNTTTGALIISGGLGVAGRINGGATGTFSNLTIQTNASIGGNLLVSGTITSSGTIPSWTSAGTIQSVGWGATTTAPTIGTTTANNLSYRQVGPKEWEVSLVYQFASGGSGGSGDYLFTLPNGLQFDTTIPYQRIYTANVGANTWVLANYAVPTASGLINNATVGGQVYPIVYTSTTYRILTTSYGTAVQCWGSGFYGLGGVIQMTFRFTST